MEFEALKKVRSPVRRAATATMKLIEAEIKKGNEMSTDLLEELLAKLIDKELYLLKLDEDILKVCKEEDIENESEKQQEYKDLVITWKLRANKILHNKSETRGSNSAGERISENRSLDNRSDQKCTVKLPRLQIPQFDGNIIKFNDFMSQFETAINQNSSISDVEKFNYLKSYLTNDAESAIRGLALNSENYKIALEILKERFGRTDIIVDAHMSKLLNLNPVRKSYEVHALRRLYTECQTHIRGLENNGINPNSYSCLLYPILLKAIPKELSLEFSRKMHDKKENTITELLEFLKIEIQCRERNEHLMKDINSSNSDLRKESKFIPPEKPPQYYPKYNKSKIDYRGKNKFQENQNIPTTSAFVVDVKKCIFCVKPEKAHESAFCPLSIEQRKLALRKFGLCYFCLSKGHIYKQCDNQNKFCSKCNRKHSELICDAYEPRPTQTRETGSSSREYLLNSNKPQNIISSKVTCSNPSEEVLLETCSGFINNGSKKREINILLDNASQRCFLKKDVANFLQLPVIRQECLAVYTFGAREPIQKTYDVVRFIVSNSRDPEKKITIEALVSDVISSSPFVISTSKIKQTLDLKNIQLSNINESNGNELSLLIGASYFWEIHCGEIQKLNKSLYLIDTLFGKIIQGRISPSDLTSEKHVSIMKIECCAQLNENLTQFWQLEQMGINDAQRDNLKCDKDFISRFENNLKFQDGMYETRLFWDDKPNDLKDNFFIAKRRFDNLSSKITDNWVSNEYKNIVKEQLKLNIVEECSNEFEANSYYMPHSYVVRADKETTKVRLVFDASAKGKGGKSLNDCLSSGPPLNPRILDVLLRFRNFEYAFCSDIQGAFLTIGIAKEDRDYLRFLWFPNENNSKSYRILRMTRVSFGVTSSPFILAATIKFHIGKYKLTKTEIYEMLNTSLYVDDLFYGANSVDKALELSKGAKEMLSEANMNLRKFRTNSEELRNLWRDTGMSDDEITESERPLKVLGIIWNIETDTFKLDVQSLIDLIANLKNSKRCVLQTAAKVFDPVGFVSPFTVIIKSLLQEIWERGLSWDDELPAELKKKWESWCSQVPLLKNVTFDRKYFFCPLDIGQELELHIFADASPRAFGAVAYFRYELNDGSCSTSFIMAKSRIAPLKRLTLPRLELLGAVLAARIYQYLKTNMNFPVTRVFLWSDSVITLHWIKGTASKWKPFVSNRVIEIQSCTDPANWFYCRGKDNPSDLITRGATVEQLIITPTWFHGPEWLCLKKEHWPKNSNVEFCPEAAIEKRANETSALVCDIHLNQDKLFDITKYSSLNRLYRITSWIFRFVNNSSKPNKKFDELSAQELDGAETFLIKTVQSEVFGEELSCLKQGKPLQRNSSILDLNPFIDSDGVIRVGGRLQKSKFTYLQKHPVLMPAKHHFVDLLVWNSHLKVFHGGVSETLVEIREKYWIIKGRQTVKNILKKCVVCKRFNTSPGVQVNAPLPPTGIEQSPPFSVVGIDFGGPLFVKDSDEKHYILLFTCGVTRAVHLELVVSLTTETFLLALRRFISRRGLCVRIITDNARTFKRAEFELRNLWTIISHPLVKEFYASNRIQWQYIVEKASWWGGFYERLIRSVKVPLRKTLGKTTLTREELETVIIEIEAVVNSRPLTYVPSDLNEPIPLTPAHMLLGRRINSLPPARLEFDSNLSTRKLIIRKFNYRERLIDLFWKKWYKEYLLMLRSSHCIKPTGKINDFKVNDIVLVNDDKLPRHFWKLGKIINVFPGRDGKIRSCEVKTSTSVIKRPIQLLNNLEVE